MSSYDDATALADAHRAHCGDDVILHYPEDEGWGFVCEDCGWGISYDDDPHDDYWDDDEEETS